MKARVGIIMGSDSDLLVMQEAATILTELGVAHELTIISAHRTPDRMVAYAKDAKKRGLQVIIAGAGGAAHLPGMVAAFTTLPVVGVPIQTKTMNGLDSLLSIAQMPPGVPVAAVAVNGAKNAGLLAAQILAITDAKIEKKVMEFKKKQESDVLVKVKALKKVGVQTFLSSKGGK